MKTKDINREPHKTKQCGYCGGYFPPEQVGNHSTNNLGEYYCDACEEQLVPPNTVMFCEDYVNGNC